MWHEIEIVGHQYEYRILGKKIFSSAVFVDKVCAFYMNIEETSMFFVIKYFEIDQKIVVANLSTFWRFLEDSFVANHMNN